MINFNIIFFPLADMASAFWSSTLPGKVIVLILFFGSAAAWTIMWTKGVQLKSAGTKTQFFLKDFRKENNVIGIISKSKKYTGTPLNLIYLEGCSVLIQELNSQGVSKDDILSGEHNAEDYVLSSNQMETIRSVVDRNIADQALELEDQMGLLATAVSAAPFLGLLGTVWGVMDAFSGMADSGSAALSAVAPGISGALLTTIIGLIVALPSMIGYNLLSSKIRNIAVQMDNFGQEFMSKVHNNYSVEVDQNG